MIFVNDLTKNASVRCECIVKGVNFYKQSYFLEIDKFLVMFLLPGGSSVTFINCSLLADMNKLVFEPVSTCSFH